ncbi:hypothetical protein GCM10025734_28780 [Kitasatospora paranensis]
MARVDVDLGDHLPSSVDISMVRGTVPTGGNCPSTENFGGLPRERCSRTPEGYRIAVVPMQSGGERYVLQRPDGITLELLLYNGIMSGEGAGMTFTASRPGAPGTADLWQHVVRSPLWDTRVAVRIAQDGAERASAAQR